VSIEATMSEMGQTLPSHSAPVRINVCFSRQVTNRGQVVNEAKGQCTKSLRSSPLRGGRSREGR
jgi:hypothetical protein